MSRELARYDNPLVVEHLASNYVLGLLSINVVNRLDVLRQDSNNALLNSRIQFWENKMSPLNNKVPIIEPKPNTWTNIQTELGFVEPKPDVAKWYQGFTIGFSQLATAFSLMLVVVMGAYTLSQPEPIGSLSYVAVLADEQQKPQVVAATYGESQTLLLDIVALPKVEKGETFELWVTSKTDFQTRSLGEIPVGADSFSRQLTNAEWRLIKDSDSLLISIEEEGGSPIGEPMGEIVSSGACVRLSAWQEKV